MKITDVKLIAFTRPAQGKPSDYASMKIDWEFVKRYAVAEL